MVKGHGSRSGSAKIIDPGHPDAWRASAVSQHNSAGEECSPHAVTLRIADGGPPDEVHPMVLASTSCASTRNAPDPSNGGRLFSRN